ncbi:family S53 protease [Roridomyces roridus]|uniref:Family S53 protease n=1 Tax=Roridomyces roridus TaxID=1738132 RepID=A0AAD7BLR1_9AGAR|nr:family S53 protease [Roridomyces roridus]
MRPFSLCLLLAFSFLSRSHALVVHESISVPPSSYTYDGPAALDEALTLRVALAHTNLSGLEEMTYAVSDPTSMLYGRHLTTDEVLAYIKPAPETHALVSGWLSENGVTVESTSFAGDLLKISLSVAKANHLLSTEFGSFTHAANGKKSVRTLRYFVPETLQQHIRFIHPTIAFMGSISSSSLVVVAHTEVSAGAPPVSCETLWTPQCTQDTYGVPSSKATNSPSNVLGVAGFFGQYANSQDLNVYLSTFRPDLVGSSFNFLSVDDGINNQTLSAAGAEADFDIETTVGLASGVPVTFISVGPDNPDGVLGAIDIVDAILSQPPETRPTVLTTSYNILEEAIPLSVDVAICNAFMQLGAAGISVLFSSGDGGVGGPTQNTSCTTFLPTFSGGCPFITAVGGSTGLPPQVAASFSGGGFSNYFPKPRFQLDDVASYVTSLGQQYSGLYNTNGRGYPDVAAQAVDVAITWQGVTGHGSGTSAASPIFASIIALVNDRLIGAGRPVLGFLNPFLYSPAGRAAFDDVVSGSNPGCGTDGFSASPGWDPVTGLGTPKFERLLAAVGL